MDEAHTAINSQDARLASIRPGAVSGGSDWHSGGWSVGRGIYGGGHGDRAYGLIDQIRISAYALERSEFLINSC